MTDGVSRPGKSKRAVNGRRLARSGEDFDIIIGILGFWALVLLVGTVWMEVTGQFALWWALGLLAALLAIYGMVRLRRRLPDRR